MVLAATPAAAAAPPIWPRKALRLVPTRGSVAVISRWFFLSEFPGIKRGALLVEILSSKECPTTKQRTLHLGASRRAGHLPLALTIRFAPQAKEAGVHQKKTPLLSMPICAKLTIVEAGSETNWKPCPVLTGVVAVTAMVTFPIWKKSPRNWFPGSLKPAKLAITLLHSMSSELMIPLANPNVRAGLKLFETLKASNTEQMWFALRLAVPPAKSTLAVPGGSGVVHKTRLSETPASHEWKPRGLAGKPNGFPAAGPGGRLSSHMNDNVPLCWSPSTPIKTPVMNRQSVWNPYVILSPVSNFVPVPVKNKSAWPIIP